MVEKRTRDIASAGAGRGADTFLKGDLDLYFIANAMQLYKVCTCLASSGQAAHNDYMLTSLHQVILQQSLTDGLDQCLS